jgi:hypothetical protein
MFNGLYDMMDGAMAEALGVDLEIYIDIIDNKCTFEEADFIISAVWGEDESEIEKAKEIFNKYI